MEYWVRIPSSHNSSTPFVRPCRAAIERRGFFNLAGLIPPQLAVQNQSCKNVRHSRMFLAGIQAKF